MRKLVTFLTNILCFLLFVVDLIIDLTKTLRKSAEHLVFVTLQNLVYCLALRLILAVQWGVQIIMCGKFKIMNHPKRFIIRDPCCMLQEL